MELREMEYRKELEQSLKKLNSLAIKANNILGNMAISEDEDLFNGAEKFKKILEQEKSLIDWMVIIVNNMWSDGIMDLKEANIWYNDLYKSRKIAQDSEEQLVKIFE